MVANRFLGNPTDRDENGGLRNRRCHGSRTEAPRETEGIATVPLPCVRAAFLSKQYHSGRNPRFLGIEEIVALNHFAEAG
jgi:hypothetical protein